MKPVLLCILDGFGYSEDKFGNAIAAAQTPNLDKMYSDYPNTLINASGLAVGLPDGQMGNSEVGHTNIGAGRVVYQELTRITKSIKDGDFYKNDELCSVMESVTGEKSLHLIGLLSDGGVHSHIEHLYGLLEMAKQKGVEKVFVHCFMDGRDVPPTSGKNFIEQLQLEMSKIGTGKIATVIGRYYAMDRDNRWDRVETAYSAMIKGEGEKTADIVKSMAKSYEDKITDEFIKPLIAEADGMIKNGDSVVFFNFRPDRAREITRSIVDEDFAGFKTVAGIKTNFVTLTQYDKTMPNVSVAFKPDTLENTLGEYLEKNNLRQLRIAETEKYAHVTFFLNGGVEQPYANEDRALISSPDVATYDLKPEMSAYLVTDELIKRLQSKKYDIIVLNLANCDMVGHTGVFSAAVKAVEVVDECVGRILAETLNQGGVMLLTADHGNADKMYDGVETSPFTAHTTNAVPFIVAGAGDVSLKDGGKLADISPTILKLIGLEKPAEMTGSNIVL